MEYILKVCKKCGKEQSIENFSLDSSASDGHQKWCKDCWHNFHPQNRTTFSITSVLYGWSKWGGSHSGLVQEELTEEWHCQACGEKETNELPPFMYEYAPREYIRICSKCQNILLQKEIQPQQFDTLVSIVRVRRSSY